MGFSSTLHFHIIEPTTNTDMLKPTCFCNLIYMFTKSNIFLGVTVYPYCLDMRVIALLLSTRYQQASEAATGKIVGTEKTIKVLLPEYQVYKCFIILNNCAIQNSKLCPFLVDF
jgi:hypothetical protein